MMSKNIICYNHQYICFKLDSKLMTTLFKFHLYFMYNEWKEVLKDRGLFLIGYSGSNANDKNNGLRFLKCWNL